MSEPVVPCPACGAGTPMPAGAAAPCPRCGLLVSAAGRRRVRAESAAESAADASRGSGGGGVMVVAAVGLGIAAAVVVGFLYFARMREQQRAHQDALVAEERAVMAEEQHARERAAGRVDLAALPAAIPGLFPAGGPLPPDVAAKQAAELGQKAIGVWRGPGPDGGTREVEYRADGTFRDAVTGGPAPREWAGTWEVVGTRGTRVLRVARLGGGPMAVQLSFEGDELIHDAEPGRATVLRR